MHIASAPVDACRLCGRRAALQWSHIIPRWTYRRITQSGGGPNPVFVDGEKASLGGKQFAAHLLCKACEQRIGEWDAEAAKATRQNDGSFPLRDGARLIRRVEGTKWALVDVSESHPQRLGRFAISVIWRASLAPHIFPKSELGKYRETVRSYLAADGQAAPAAVFVVALLLDAPSLPLEGLVVAPSVARTTPMQRMHHFALFGVQFLVFVGERTPASIGETCILRTGRAVLARDPKLAASVARLFAFATPVGSLARKRI